MASKELFSDGLSQDVSRVTCAEHLRQDKVPLSDPLLDPQLPCGQVADLANASAPAYSNGSTAVGADLRGSSRPKAAAKLAMPRPSAEPLTTPANSASPELSAMVFWVTDQCFRTCGPLQHSPPDVDLRVITHPAKSVSTNVLSPSSRSTQGNK